MVGCTMREGSVVMLQQLQGSIQALTECELWQERRHLL